MKVSRTSVLALVRNASLVVRTADYLEFLEAEGAGSVTLFIRYMNEVSARAQLAYIYDSGILFVYLGT